MTCKQFSQQNPVKLSGLSVRQFVLSGKQNIQSMYLTLGNAFKVGTLVQLEDSKLLRN